MDLLKASARSRQGLESPLSTVSTSDTRVEMTQLGLPGLTNTHGTLFGGQLVAWMDTAASVAANRFCRSAVVTVSIDELHFAQPIELGDTVVLYAQVNQAWGSSMGDWCACRERGSENR